MPEVWQTTLADFVGEWPVEDPVTASQAAADERQLEREVNEDSKGWLRCGMKPTSAPGFYITGVPGTEHAILVSYSIEDRSYDVCGGYVGPSLWIAQGSRGRGLAAELVLARANLEGGPINAISYTTAGLAAHISAHRLSVQCAIRDGYRVPLHILADYPEFMPSKILKVSESKVFQEDLELKVSLPGFCGP